MRQSFAFRRSLRFIALALCSVSIVAFVSPASARPHHAGRHARGYHAGHHAKHHYAYRHYRHAGRMSRLERSAQQMQAGGFADSNPSFMESNPQMAAPGGFGSPNVAAEARADRGGRRGARLRQADHTSRWERGVAQMQARGLADANASVATNATVTPPGGGMASGFTSSNVVAEARKYVGGNPTGRGSLWCARFANMVLQHSGYRWHRLGHGEFVREIRPARFRPAGRRHRGDVARPARRPCRHHHRHRCIRKSDHDLRQQRQPRSRSPGVARPNLRLRHADELIDRTRDL